MTGGDRDRYVIDGRFELLQRLGGGGMGLVWRARDLMLQREVALKEVRSPDPSVHGSDPHEQRVVRERVLREAQALARLQHPNVVTIYHIVDSHELAHPWLVMELVTGGSLDDLLEARVLSVHEALRVGRGVLGALRAAHAAGIQHRDVKPGNVLLRGDGTPVLTDFGIAALEAKPGLTATGMLIGSPEYMAPERVHGIEGNPASDLWSLALMLYVGLEGRNPLSRDTTIATIAAVSEGYVPPPVRSGALGPVLSAVLVPDPARRPTAEQLDAMLAQVEHGESVTAFQPQAQAPIPGPRTPNSGTLPPQGYEGWSQTRQFGGPTDQIPGAAPQPPINPYGQTDQVHAGMSPAAAEKYRSKAFRLTALSTVGTLAIMGFSVWASTRAQHNANQITNNLTTAPTFSIPSSPGNQAQDSTTQQSAAQSSAPAATGNLLTPAGIRAVIAQVLKSTGGTHVVAMNIYPDHATFDVVKKDDPTAFDTYLYSKGQVTFWVQGQALDDGEPALDPNKINWDALPGLIKQADTSLNVKVTASTERYVVVDSDIITHVPEMRVYMSDQYHDGYLAADLNGKVTRTEPA
jgi:serine/threonine protein kinase